MRVTIEISKATVDDAFLTLSSTAKSEDRKRLQQAYAVCQKDELIEVPDDFYSHQKEQIHMMLAMSVLVSTFEMLEKQEKQQNQL